MARLNLLVDNNDDDDGELPDLATILRGESSPRKSSQRAAGVVKESKSKFLGKSIEDARLMEDVSKNEPIASSNQVSSRKGNPLGSLKLTHVNSLLLPLSKGTSSSVKKLDPDEDSHGKAPQVRCTPKRAARKPIDYSVFSARKADRGLSMSEDDESFTDLSGFIVPDSDGDEGDWPKQSKSKGFHNLTAKASRNDQTYRRSRNQDLQQNEKSRGSSEIIDLSSSETKHPSTLDPQPPLLEKLPQNRSVSVESLALDEPLSQLRFSPPRSRKPSTTRDFVRPVTPPSSPSKSKLGSPWKKHRIPPTPHRPSIDAFWSQNVINDWNDQYSPKKAPQTPGRNRLLTLDEDRDGYATPSTSPRKSPLKSPSKSPTKKEREAVRAFNANKASLATRFLTELDEKITNSQISSLAACTGGIIIIWSKKLSSTAGRANWRREAIRHRNSDGTTSETTHRHHASIELAEKVIDCEDRLINVLAHEYCHLANFMVSGVKNQPHGKEFKAWAAKVTSAFGDKGVEVTTKHGYDITYKYIWTCGDCGLEYKRHSKSIDPSKHSCGGCKGRLVQILPAPRKESEYQRFVKANWERVKRSAVEGAGMGEINGLLAKEWEAKKAQERGSQEAEVIKVAEDEDEDREESPELDNVARKLDFLNLGA